MRQIKFNRCGSSSTFGNFAPGDLLRCADDVAHHFVHEAHCAVYVDQPTAQASAQLVTKRPPAVPPRRKAA